MSAVDASPVSAAPVLPGPIAATERISSIDTVRGFAVLGILVMNIVEFAWPDEAYGNPRFAGGHEGFDLWTYYLQAALFDGKMRALFSMLFGAGLVLIAERMAQKGQGLAATDVLLRRCLWLVPFGIVHRFFLQWTGDILYQYGLLGMVALVFRHLRPRTLLILGTVWMLAFVPIGCRKYSQSVDQRAQATEATRLQAANEKVPEAMAGAQRRWQTRAESIPPKPEVLKKEIDDGRVGYWQLFRNRWDYHHNFQSAFLYYYWVFDVLGMMLLGMGLGKLGFFHGTCRRGVYIALLAVGGVVAAAQLWWAIAWQATGFNPVALELRLIQDTTYAHSRALVALAWASALLLVLRAGWLRAVMHALGAVGRMAFSCYILQTVVGSLLFWGYGFALFGVIPRAQLMLVVLGMSLLQIGFSLLWLRAFRFGPLEWAWRSLTWWRLQPLRRRSG
jgi:uncharacterized protein